jgi:hypothetical protein
VVALIHDDLHGELIGVRGPDSGHGLEPLGPVVSMAGPDHVLLSA